MNESLSTATDPCAAADLSVEDALQTVLGEARPVSGSHVVPLADAVGRVNAEDIAVPRPIPGHTNAAVDGYAFRVCDLAPGTEPTCFRLIGESLAGLFVALAVAVSVLGGLALWFGMRLGLRPAGALALRTALSLTLGAPLALTLRSARILALGRP